MSLSAEDRSAARELALHLRAANRWALVLGFYIMADKLTQIAGSIELLAKPPDAVDQVIDEWFESERRCVVNVPASWVRDGLVKLDAAAECEPLEPSQATARQDKQEKSS